MVFFAKIHWYYRIRNFRKKLLFENKYIIIVHNKITLKIFDMTRFLMKYVILLNGYL